MSAGMQSVWVRHGGVEAEVVPARGGLVATLKVDGTDVLFCDRSTVEDPAKSVRGGIPVLFPFAGKLENDRLVAANTTAKQHGFARNHAWDVVAEDKGRLRMTLSAQESMKASYPYPFSLEQELTLLPRGLLVEMRFSNRGVAPMPVSPGWHPYFCCDAARKNEITSDHKGHDPRRLDPALEFDFGIATPPGGQARFTIPGLGTLRLSYMPDMRHLQFWSQPGRPFVCIEPFWGGNNTVNTAARMDVAPGEQRVLWMRMELE